VNGHMVMETFVALAFKHLSKDHYVFKLLEPVSGDVGFVNRSWAADLVFGNSGGPNGHCLRFMTPQSFFSVNGVRSQIVWAKKTFEPKSWFWFDQDGYVNGGCGVKDSTAFAFRDTARQVFHATLRWTSFVVESCWHEQDEALRAWWDSIWWSQMEPARRELSKETLSHVLATCIVQATFVHDRAHESWLPENHSRLLWGLSTRGQTKSPLDYLPSAVKHASYRLGLMALNAFSLESPLLSYRTVFREERFCDALSNFEDALARVVLTTPGLHSIGSMSY